MIYNETIAKKLHTYFTQRQGMFEYSKGWVKGNCPDCGKLKLGVHIEDARVNCFVCGSKGNPINWILQLEGFKTKIEVFQLLKTYEESDYLKPTAKIRDFKEVTLPESFKLMVIGNSELGKLARAYMKGRGFNNLKLSQRYIGYCTRGEYAGCIIFPFYQHGELVYFTARRYIMLGDNKFNNPNEEDFGVGKSMLIYNIDALAQYNKIRIVESITNSLTIGDNAIVISGKTISNYQLSLLIKSPAQYFSIILDPDAIKEAYKLALRLVPYKKVKVVELPGGENDINDLGKKRVKEIEKGYLYGNYSQLYSLYTRHI